jgi:hypothetical protein
MPRKPATPGEPQPAAQAAPQTADIDLPDIAEIDQAALTAPVLTKQGWLVPDDKRRV